MGTFNRKTHWQQQYETKGQSGVSWFQRKPVMSLELIHNCTALRAEDPIIDIGGGASVLVDYLVEEGFAEITVLDISAPALTASQQRLGARSKQVDWVEADITSFHPKHRIALWHDRATFHFLTDPADRRAYVNALKQALMPGGYLIIATFAVGGPDKCSGLPINQYDASRLLAELGDEFELLEEASERHITPSQRTQDFTYFRLIRSRAI